MSFDDHPFTLRLSRYGNVGAADLRAFSQIIDCDAVIGRKRELVADGYEYKKLCFVSDGYAIRYKLLRNGKRQVINIIFPGDVVGFPASFLDRSMFSVLTLTELRFNSCDFDAYMDLSFSRPQFALALSWLAAQEAAIYAEHIVDVGRRTPIERLAHFLLETQARLAVIGRASAHKFELPFSQEVMADVLGLSVPHLNRMMQQLRGEKLIAGRERLVEFKDVDALQTLAQYHPARIVPIPSPPVPRPGVAPAGLGHRSGLPKSINPNQY
ncbi:MAG TPA: Crp/Fnr family transcriptional regulator [Pseudolabrys sp.]|jgi:CRP-like cAMP-binding protein|nr:Crp/Fnr family transcriptional regulator [Pseudolabrys sp.]